MSYVGWNWPDTDTASKKPYSYNFIDRIPPGDAIATVTWELTVTPNLVYKGVDPSPASHISQDSHDSFTALAWLDSLVENTRYKLVAFIVTTAGVEDDLYSYITCVPRP